MPALFVRDLIALYHADEIPLGVATQGGLAEMEIVGNEVVGLDKMIGEVAAATARHQNFFADLIRLLEN